MPKAKTMRKRSRTSRATRAAKKSHKPEPATTPPPLSGRSFPIVGLGASAGGLEALEEFFKHAPSDSGMAFVVVTHQHPGHASLLPELLRKSTAMPVAEAGDNLRVKPDCIYVARPEGYLALLNGRFQLMDSKVHSGVRLPIDYFFRSLAEDQRGHAVGIILSGTASDGTLGVKAIKGATGMTMAQEPESAKYPGMPRSAIATGLVDYVLPAGQLLTQGPGDGGKEQVVSLLGQGAEEAAPQFGRESEGDQEVRGIDELVHFALDPAARGQSATLGTGFMVAGMIGEVGVAAMFAGKGLPAQCRGAALGYGPNGATLLR